MRYIFIIYCILCMFDRNVLFAGMNIHVFLLLRTYCNIFCFKHIFNTLLFDEFNFVLFASQNIIIYFVGLNKTYYRAL